jgi:arylsulfatase A-like enzyme
LCARKLNKKIMQKPTRREFLKTMGSTVTSVGAFSLLASCAGIKQMTTGRKKQPNVVLVITDDQGYGDVGYHGNEKIKTPNLDKFAQEGVEFSQFYVCPVCSPTRACLMTGRYNYRTRVIDTYLGRSMMDPDEVTIAEILREAGYATGIFGKWHLGDNYPMRTIDQGFQESVVHLGGGLCQPSDPPGNSYFDPILQHNGKPRKFKGYCTDIFTDGAIKFIESNRDRPFFVYLATNAPHRPLQISEKYVAAYKAMGLKDQTAKIYGMVTNIDENLGRLLAKLKELGLDEDTIVIFMTDNGPTSLQADRYTAGLRGQKGSVYEGGIRVPFFIRWPVGFKGDRKINRIAAHIDIMPTLLDACGVDKPAGVPLDGVSLMPLLQGSDTNGPDRTLFFQWHRGDEPQLYRCFAARNQKYKLVQSRTTHGKWSADELNFELFDISKDPFEKNNIAARHPEIVEKMKRDYKVWFENVSSTRGFAPPRIYLGTPYENPTILTRQDWRGAKGWSDNDMGYWQVKVAHTGRYAVTLRLSSAVESPGKARLKLGNLDLSRPIEKGACQCTFGDVRLQKGPARLAAWAQLEAKKLGARYVEVKWLD